MSSVKLRPCPFCVARAVSQITETCAGGANVRMLFGIRCTECKAGLQNDYMIDLSLYQDGGLKIYRDDRERAEDLWNAGE